MKAVIQFDERQGNCDVRQQIGEVDIGELGQPAGTAWTCPRCGCMQFTVVEKFGRVVLSCFRCPTHLALIP